MHDEARLAALRHLFRGSIEADVPVELTQNTHELSEASLAGRPSIIFRSGGMSESATDGVDACLLLVKSATVLAAAIEANVLDLSLIPKTRADMATPHSSRSRLLAFRPWGRNGAELTNDIFSSNGLGNSQTVEFWYECEARAKYTNQ